ncbi:MAG TPA: NAD(P)-binding domain-containing protein [Candidatus Thermoplasmatota archaeon]
MKIGVLGTGMVGETLGSKLVERGHEVKMGSRDARNPKAIAWAQKAGLKASAGSFQDAAKFGELLINCTMGSASVEALKSAGENNLDDKIIVDIANALDFSKGMPPGLTVNVATDSLAEHIQKTFPRAKVVKTLNTVTAPVMVNPASLPGDHVVFLSGNEDAAKQIVAQLLENDFGWKKTNIVDLGDVTTARAQEALIIPWLRLWGKFGSPMFNWQVVTTAKQK